MHTLTPGEQLLLSNHSIVLSPYCMLHCEGLQRKELSLNLIAHVTHEPYQLFLLYFLFALVLGTTTKGRLEGKIMHHPKITIMNWGHAASQL